MLCSKKNFDDLIFVLQEYVNWYVDIVHSQIMTFHQCNFFFWQRCLIQWKKIFDSLNVRKWHKISIIHSHFVYIDWSILLEKKTQMHRFTKKQLCEWNISDFNWRTWRSDIVWINKSCWADVAEKNDFRFIYVEREARDFFTNNFFFINRSFAVISVLWQLNRFKFVIFFFFSDIKCY